MDDLISRQKAIMDAESWVAVDEYEKHLQKNVIEWLKEFPLAQPEPKKGEWSDGYRWQRCSLCKQTGKKSWNYCPNCGADMRGKKDG